MYSTQFQHPNGLLKNLLLGKQLASKILKEVDKKFIESFKGSQHGSFDNPWIDLSIVCIDQKAKQMTFSSANRKLMHIDKSNQMNIEVQSLQFTLN